jgi:hypothetical protein
MFLHGKGYRTPLIAPTSSGFGVSFGDFVRTAKNLARFGPESCSLYSNAMASSQDPKMAVAADQACFGNRVPARFSMVSGDKDPPVD